MQLNQDQIKDQMNQMICYKSGHMKSTCLLIARCYKAIFIQDIKTHKTKYVLAKLDYMINQYSSPSGLQWLGNIYPVSRNKTLKKCL